MKLNIQQLKSAIAKLPDPNAPEYRGQIYEVPYFPRLVTLNEVHPEDTLPVIRLKFKSERYCKHPNRCWYEWELLTTPLDRELDRELD